MYVLVYDQVLKRYLLRRQKGDVEKSLPSREETVITVVLTDFQKRVYRALYEKNFRYLRRACGGRAPALQNLFMALRQCCNHPYLVKGVEDQVLSGTGVGAAAATKADHSLSASQREARGEAMWQQQLVVASGKMVLLDKLLPKLKEQGKKVLIFSQMVKMLDLLEAYFNVRGYRHERIDGSVSGRDRQAGIDRFTDPASDSFIFMLSTRAGGVGINLTAADTVIIFDNDWNPQNDLQAQARCHRIGQVRQKRSGTERQASPPNHCFMLACVATTDQEGARVPPSDRWHLRNGNVQARLPQAWAGSGRAAVGPHGRRLRGSCQAARANSEGAGGPAAVRCIRPDAG